MKEKWYDTLWSALILVSLFFIVGTAAFFALIYGFVWTFDWYLNLPWPNR